MDQNIAIERILEIESLTDELGDEEANYLLDWASAHAPDLIKDLTDDDIAGEKVNALIAVLRQVNRMAAHRKTRSADEVQGEVEEYAGLVAEAFGARPSLGPAMGLGSSLADAAPDALARDLIQKPDLDFVKTMLAIADTAVPSESQATTPPTGSATPPPEQPPPASQAGSTIAEAKPEDSASDSADEKPDEDSPTLSI